MSEKIINGRSKYGNSWYIRYILREEVDKTLAPPLRIVASGEYLRDRDPRWALGVSQTELAPRS